MLHTVNNLVFGNIWDFGNPFTIVIDTRNVRAGSSNEYQWKFPVNFDLPDSSVNYLFDWGDGTYSRATNKAQASVPHDYAVPGIYTINVYQPKTIAGVIIAPRYENHPAERPKILKILRLGNLRTFRSAFNGCPNLDFSELADEVGNIGAESAFSNLPLLTTFGNLKRMNFTGANANTFSSCVNFNQPNLEISIAASATQYGLFTNCIRLQSLAFLYVNPSFIYSFANMFMRCDAWNADFTVMTNVNWANVTNMTNFMTKLTTSPTYVAYNPLYYDNLLRALDLAGRSNVTLHFSSRYTSVGAVHRANLIGKGWTINDLGLV